MSTAKKVVGSITYRIEKTGDADGSYEVSGDWNEVVNAVAEDMYHEPTDSDRAKVRDMLENGFDGEEGWNGEHVTLRFEDGSISVEAFRISQAGGE